MSSVTNSIVETFMPSLPNAVKETPQSAVAVAVALAVAVAVTLALALAIAIALTITFHLGPGLPQLG